MFNNFEEDYENKLDDGFEIKAIFFQPILCTLRGSAKMIK